METSSQYETPKSYRFGRFWAYLLLIVGILATLAGLTGGSGVQARVDVVLGLMSAILGWGLLRKKAWALYAMALGISVELVILTWGLTVGANDTAEAASGLLVVKLPVLIYYWRRRKEFTWGRSGDLNLRGLADGEQKIQILSARITSGRCAECGRLLRPWDHLRREFPAHVPFTCNPCARSIARGQPLHEGQLLRNVKDPAEFTRIRFARMAAGRCVECGRTTLRLWNKPHGLEARLFPWTCSACVREPRVR